MATIPLTLSPFPVPTSVFVQMPPGRREDGIRQAPVYRLEDLPREIVQQLLSEFAAGVWEAWEEKQNQVAVVTFDERGQPISLNFRAGNK